MTNSKVWCVLLDIVIVFGTPQIRSGARVLSTLVYHALMHAHKPARTHSPPPTQMEGAQSKKELALEAKLREVVAFAYKVCPPSFPRTPGVRLPRLCEHYGMHAPIGHRGGGRDGAETAEQGVAPTMETERDRSHALSRSRAKVK